MNCQCCGTQVGGDKNYVIFALHSGQQVALCKACMMIGMRAASGSIVTTEKEVIQQPTLAFPFKPKRSEFCKIARAEGWLTQGVPGDAVKIEKHYEEALINNYFDGQGWKKNMNRTALDCFARSCRNIRDNYPQWLALNK